MALRLSRSCSQLSVFILFAFFALAPSAVPAMAGQETAASIIGQVKDESGGVLPGVTVTATSPALQVAQMVSVTNERGEYRLTPLPIGTYQVEYALSGFQSVRQQNVRLTVGFVAKLDVALKVGALTETITVSGAAPVVDVTSTSTSTQFTRETLELIPSSKNGIIALLAQAPGVRPNFDVGGSSLNLQIQSRAFGQIGEPASILEGVRMSGKRAGGGGGGYWDYNSIEEARVQTVGTDAEGPTRGVQLTALVKSGGNDLHGGGGWRQTNHRFQSDNLSPALIAQGIGHGNPLDTRWDVNADLGGRIVRNKLWYYAAYRRFRNVEDVLNAFKPDGSPAVSDQLSWFTSGKLSYQMTPSNKLVGFYTHNHKVDISGASQFVAWESRLVKNTIPDTGKVEWQATVGSSLVASLQYGHWQYGAHFDPAPEATDKVSTRDLATLQQTGVVASAGQVSEEHRHHTRGSLGWYRPNLFAGNHEFKAGFDYLDDRTGIRADNGPAGNYVLNFTNGVPTQLQTRNWPVTPNSLVHTLNLFVKDDWTVARRLTLGLGLRYAHDDGFIEALCREAGQFAAAQCFPKVQFNVWNTVAPRIHASYSLTGDGKTVIKGGWGRFDHERQTDPEVGGANPAVSTTTTYRWRDLNGNRNYDPGEVDLNTNGPDFISRSGGANRIPNPNEKEPKSDEFTVSLEREVIQNVALRLTGIYFRSNDVYRLTNNLRPASVYNVPVTRPDPGPDGRVGSADDGAPFTYFEYPVALAGSAFEQFSLINDPNATQRYKSFEIATSKRLASGWQFMASYSATKQDNPLVNSLNPYAQFETTYGADTDPNAELFAADRTWQWLGKVSAAYLLPAGVMLSANFEHRSGDAWARQVLFTGGRTIPSIVLRVEPLGSQKMQNTNLLDVRAEKNFALRGSHKAAVRVNVYNLMNKNTPTAVTMRAGASFNVPTAIMPPRIVELSASYTF